MRTPVDALVARALRQARGNPRTLEQARSRIERGIADRPSPVGWQAWVVVRRALELVNARRDRDAPGPVEGLAIAQPPKSCC